MRIGKRRVASLAAVALLVVAGCADKEQARPGPGRGPVVSGVEVVEVRASTGPLYAEAVGTVRAGVAAAVAPQVMGRIVAFPVSEGSRVEKGGLIAALDDAALKAQAVSAEGALAEAEAGKAEADRAVAQTRAAKTLAEKTFDRFAKLAEEKVISRQEFDEAEARKTVAVQEHARAVERASQAAGKIVQAKGQSRAAEAMLSYARVTAPFAGIVAEKRAEQGSMAVPGMPIVVLEDTSRYRLEAAVSETHIGAIRIGSTVEAALDAMPGKVISAKVSEIVPGVDPASRTFVVKADLSAPKLRSGLSGRIRFAAGTAQSLTVPRAAVSHAGGYDGVFVVTPDNVARLVMIRTGRETGDTVEVLSGLSAGSRIARSGVDRLVDGAKLEVRP